MGVKSVATMYLCSAATRWVDAAMLGACNEQEPRLLMKTVHSPQKGWTGAVVSHCWMMQQKAPVSDIPESGCTENMHLPFSSPELLKKA